MKKMKIEEAAKHFGISKEAIHNRIRRGTLQAVVENDIKYVFVETSKKDSIPVRKSSINDKFSEYLQEQNRMLREKIEKLESQTRKLHEEKERMLIEERKRIELIYKEKDEQLKNILNAIGSKFLLEAKPLHEEEHFDAQIEEKSTPSPISLKKFLKKSGISKKRRMKIIKKVKKNAKREERFFVKKNKIYLDTSAFDYSDLLL